MAVLLLHKITSANQKKSLYSLYCKRTKSGREELCRYKCYAPAYAALFEFRLSTIK